MTDTGGRTQRALAALRAADQKNMGRVAGGMGAEATDRLADLESCMRAYRTWSPSLVPGLLQVGTYTAGAIRSRTPSLGAEDLTTRITHRRDRAEAFLKRMALPEQRGHLAWFLIGEEAITLPLQNAHAHGAQLQHLLELSETHPNIIVQVLSETSPTLRTVEPFDIYYLDPGPTVGHLETLVGGWYTVVSEDVARLHGTFSEMIASAMSTRDTRLFIREVLSSCWEPTAEPSSPSPVTPTPTTASTWPDLPSEL